VPYKVSHVAGSTAYACCPINAAVKIAPAAIGVARQPTNMPAVPA
jgi:hypothetical protein